VFLISESLTHPEHGLLIAADAERFLSRGAHDLAREAVSLLELPPGSATWLAPPVAHAVIEERLRRRRV
jgi:hypothetical protein